MKIKSSKLMWQVTAIVTAAAAICGIVFLAFSYFDSHSVDRYLEDAYIEVSSSENVSTSDFRSPIDFESLWGVNTDIYAWIEVPGTKINYPIARSETDDSYYLDHSIDGSKDKKGTLFTEYLFNSNDFSDPVTVIYGHDMKNGAMFGRLQNYSQKKYFDSHSEIKVYLPDRTLSYEVFAAVPFSGKHILYYWDFSDESQFNGFIKNIRSTKSLLANFNEDVEVTSSDKIIILSTCLKSDNTKRYLVLAVLKDEEA